MNNDDLLKALGRFTPEQIVNAIENTKRVLKELPQQDSDSDQVKDKDKVSEQDKRSKDLDVLIKDAFAFEDTFSVSSYDRQMVRHFLGEHAKDNVYCAELHKWWDGTSFSVLNDWLFTDEMKLELELLNKDATRKFLRLKVSL